MQEIVIIHMTDIVKGKRFEKSGLSSVSSKMNTGKKQVKNKNFAGEKKKTK